MIAGDESDVGGNDGNLMNMYTDNMRPHCMTTSTT